MGWSPLSTEVHNTSQYSARTRGVAGVVLHHGATTSADAIIYMETSGSRQVSSHQVIKDTRNAGIVQEQFRAWSLSDAYWDSWAFTVECANESTDGWTISAASHETLAQTVANWAARYGFWPHRDGDPTTWTVYGHREIYTIWGGSYATACPGGMNLDWIAKRAQQILTPKKEVESDMPQILELVGGSLAVVGNKGGTAGSRGFSATSAEGKILKKVLDGKQVIGAETIVLSTIYESVSKGADISDEQAKIIAAAVAASIKLPPLDDATIAKIGTEVIRQQKLPGN